VREGGKDREVVVRRDQLLGEQGRGSLNSGPSRFRTRWAIRLFSGWWSENSARYLGMPPATVKDPFALSPGKKVKTRT
jgi:hypothetical protein